MIPGADEKPAGLSGTRTRILIVDDHEVVRMGLVQLIGEQQDMEVCGEAENVSTALSALAQTSPDLVILDITLEEDLAGLELVKDIKSRYSDMKILVLSMHDEKIFAERVLRAGANGYVSKNDVMDTLLTAIRRVIDGQVWVSPSIAGYLLNNIAGGHSKNHQEQCLPTERLTDRELEVLQLIGNGFKNKQIAEKLFLSTKTVETYRERLKEKLDLPDSSALLHYAVQWAQKPC